MRKRDSIQALNYDTALNKLKQFSQDDDLSYEIRIRGADLMKPLVYEDDISIEKVIEYVRQWTDFKSARNAILSIAENMPSDSRYKISIPSEYYGSLEKWLRSEIARSYFLELRIDIKNDRERRYVDLLSVVVYNPNNYN